LKPQSLDEIIDQIACRAINPLGVADISAPALQWPGET